MKDLPGRIFKRLAVPTRLGAWCGVAGLALAAGLAPPALVAAQTAPADTASAADPLYAEPFIDIDEMRTAPVAHRYVHGGFKGTAARFSFYFPATAHYRGRFFQHITPVPDSENLAQAEAPGEYNKIGFAIASGGYFVETNGGGKLDLAKGVNPQADGTIAAYRANAAVARYSRVVAMAMYGGNRPYGYAYGGSGGAFRTVGSMENTRGVWDGAVPYVLGSTMAIPNMFTIRLRALRTLDKKFPQIVDAVEPGGSGNPYAGLTANEADVLHEATRMGFRPPSWFGYKTMGIHGLAALYGGVLAIDHSYFTDFWTKPGYLGFDHPEQFKTARMQFDTTVAMPITAQQALVQRLNLDASSNRNRGGVDNAYKPPQGAEAHKVVAYRLTGTPPAVDTFLGGDLLVQSGAAKGQRLTVARVVGNIVVLGIADPDIAAQIAPGDAVRIDNSNFLAIETYHWHQVPGPDFTVWDQFRGADGKPLYPQRPLLIGPIFVKGASGSAMTGDVEGKIIILESLWDREALAWQADWYRKRLEAHFGPRAKDMVRVYLTDHALHGDESLIEDPTRTVGYQGALQQALRDLAAWVEQGTPPPDNTNYRLEDGQMVIPATAAARGGFQPVITLSANGRARADIKRGQTVTFTGTITVPPRTGSVVAAEWVFGGKGDFPTRSPVAAGKAEVVVTIRHRFDRPGTYFPALRGVSQRQDDRDTPYARVQNLGRVRVVVR